MTLEREQQAVKNITIVLKPKVIEEFANLVPNLCLWLRRRKKNIQFLKKEKARLEKILSPKILAEITLISEPQLHDRTDLVITLGGDGTLIGVCRKLGRPFPPIFGVNTGNLGFITEFSKNEFFEDLSQYFENQYETLSLHLFTVKVYEKDKVVHKDYFLNDAVISKDHISRMFSLSVESKQDHIYTLSGDGLIISSTIGSTAYSLAAGGPIVHPDVKALVLTPICPHSLTHRPLVVPDHYNLKIRIVNFTELATLTLDGQSAYSISPQQLVVISKEKEKLVRLIKNPSRTYFHTLKEKFFHGRRKT